MVEVGDLQIISVGLCRKAEFKISEVVEIKNLDAGLLTFFFCRVRETEGRSLSTAAGLMINETRHIFVMTFLFLIDQCSLTQCANKVVGVRGWCRHIVLLHPPAWLVKPSRGAAGAKEHEVMVKVVNQCGIMTSSTINNYEGSQYKLRSEA